MNKHTLIRVFRKADRAKAVLLEQLIRNGWPEPRSIQSLQEFEKTCPEPIASEEGTQYVLRNGLWAPVKPSDAFAMSQPQFWQQTVSMYPGDIEAPAPKPDLIDEPFEVNLTAPLLGWRSWEFEGHDDIVLKSISHRGEWLPGRPMEAHCDEDTCKESPTTDCGCGIYAVDDRADTPGDNMGAAYITGQVYGWGRYVRGNSGWRAQYAYPASFYLSSTQRFLASALEPFHVPIYVDEPFQIYSPEEDGYENWQDDPDRDSGTDPEPDTAEEE